MCSRGAFSRWQQLLWLLANLDAIICTNNLAHIINCVNSDYKRLRTNTIVGMMVMPESGQMAATCQPMRAGACSICHNTGENN
jgi:hypothetical protein